MGTVMLAIPWEGPYPMTVSYKRPVAETLEARTLLTTYIVSTVADTGPGSLRQAILDANAHSGADDCAFAVPDPGVHRITPVTPLPQLTDTLNLDATTQPGYA